MLITYVILNNTDVFITFLKYNYIEYLRFQASVTALFRRTKYLILAGPV